MEQAKLIKFLWVVIAVLVVGLGTVTAIALNRAHAIDVVRDGYKGDIASLNEQVRQAKSPSPTSPPLQESIANQASPSPSVTPLPKATATPK